MTKDNTLEDEIEEVDTTCRRLNGLSALITGGAQGIGRRIALELAAEGADIVLNDLSSKKEKADKVAQYIESHLDRDTWIVEADVSDIEDVKRARDQIEDNFGEIDILVNNAGINRDNFFTKMDKDDWDKVLSVNLDSVFNCTHTFLDHLQDSKQGRVISISSVVGERGNIGQVNYASSKAGIIGFTKALAQELVRDDITVNAVAPGFICTQMVLNMPEKVKNKIKKQIPMSRFGTPKEVGRTVAFLASNDASYVTGEVIRMNGGFYL